MRNALTAVALAGCALAVFILPAGVAAAAEPPLNVMACGADPTGQADCTRLLTDLHGRRVPLYYPNGTYRFNGEALDFSGGVRVESADGVVIRNDLSPDPVVVFDNQGRLIGLQQNHLEQDERALGPKGKVRSGSLVPPPLAQAAPQTSVDVLAHWYNDAGLECRRAGGGWIGWYYWSWDFHRPALAGGKPGDPYDPARHPLLGFYRGDDPVVLDWQCYWLAEAGVRAVILCGEVDFDAWQRPEAGAHWIYELFHGVPNFGRLNYVLWAPSPWLKASDENRAKVEKAWLDVIAQAYLRNSRYYAVESGGKRYPVLFVYEGEALRGVFDNYRGAENTAAFLGRMAARFQAAGCGGVALLVRHSTSAALLPREPLEKRGVLYFNASYSDDYGTGSNYAARVASFAPPAEPRTVLNVCTSKDSHAPHPSRWSCPGSTPALFGELVRKAVAHVQSNGMPRILTCYNVAEWAEGGPGLQPNMRDRFGYLEALSSAIRVPAPTAGEHQR